MEEQIQIAGRDLLNEWCKNYATSTGTTNKNDPIFTKSAVVAFIDELAQRVAYG